MKKMYFKKLREGNKVRVKIDLIHMKSYGGMPFNEFVMGHMRGKLGTVRYTFDRRGIRIVSYNLCPPVYVELWENISYQYTKEMLEEPFKFGRKWK